LLHCRELTRLSQQPASVRQWQNASDLRGRIRLVKPSPCCWAGTGVRLRSLLVAGCAWVLGLSHMERRGLLP